MISRILLIGTFCSIGFHCRCQLNFDSIFLANANSWKVQQHKGLFGMGKPEFGPYITVNVSRFDSAFSKKKTKGDGSLEITDAQSGPGIGFDHSRALTVEKTKAYKLTLARNEDTSKCVFLISSVSNERKQTFLGKLLSRNDEGNQVVSYNRDVLGMIRIRQNELQWRFFINDFTSGGRVTEESRSLSASIAGGWLINDTDSLSIEISSSSDFIMVNKRGEQLAALTFKRKPFTIWIRNDIENSVQQAIASFFAVIFAIKDI